MFWNLFKSILPTLGLLLLWVGVVLLYRYIARRFKGFL